MKTAIALAALVGGLMVASAAGAYQIKDGGITAEEVAAVMQSKGYQASLGKDADGDPRITSSADGGKFYVYFYGCHNGPRCNAIQFEAAFALPGHFTYAKINDWNRHNRFGRAYLDDEMDPYVEMDLDVEHGFLTEGLANNLDTWAAVLPRFKKHIGW